MSKIKINKKELIIRINQESIGYTLLHYYGNDLICVDDKKLNKLYKKAYKHLKKLHNYIEDDKDSANKKI